MKKPNILLVDDNEAFLELFISLPEAKNFDIIPLTSAFEALAKLGQVPVDLIITDVQMPGMTGSELFKKVQDLYPDIPVIIITAFGSTQEAIESVKQGAFHYFEKPINDQMDRFWVTVREALSKRKMLKEVALLNKEKALHSGFSTPIIGRSNEIRKIMGAIDEIAGLPVTVLISGETGTGKGIVARAIHAASDRKDKPFFAVNCNEFAPGVLESELFGHEKGAFTGAFERKSGIFEVAHEGTLVLDEISEAPMAAQSKLLRVLEEKCFNRVGGTHLLFSDFHLLATTNRNLNKEVEKGRFRQDLFYRLNVYTIEIPPLRNRKADIVLIAEFYLRKFCQAYGRFIEGFSEDALFALGAYDWPGNVRELVNVIERAVIVCRETIITKKCLPFDLKSAPEISGLNLVEMEKLFIELALRRTANNKTKAAALLGINRKTLLEKVKKM